MNSKDKYASKKLQQVTSDKAFQALEDGKGNRAYGVTSKVSIDNEYTLTGIDFRSEYLKPEDITNEDWKKMSEEEKAKEVGNKKTEWFEFITNNGSLSFSAVLGHSKMYDSDYWTDGNTSEDFDVTKLFKPSARTASAWIKNDVDNLIGKTIKCVGVKTDTSGIFDVSVRAFVVLDQTNQKMRENILSRFLFNFVVIHLL